MKRILKFLAGLYPSAWRERYGTEYEALLEDATLRPADVFDILQEAVRMQVTSRNFAMFILPCAVAGVLVAFAISLTMSHRYVSQTLITVTSDAPEIQDNLRRDLPSLRDRTLDRDFLASVIKRDDLYAVERRNKPMPRVVDEMLSGMAIKPLLSRPKSALQPAGFVVSFAYPDAHLAQIVTNEVTARLVLENLRIRIEANAAGRPEPREVFRVMNPASLPHKPEGPSRTMFCTLGLLIGLLCGFILLSFLESHRKSLASTAGLRDLENL